MRKSNKGGLNCLYEEAIIYRTTSTATVLHISLKPSSWFMSGTKKPCACIPLSQNTLNQISQRSDSVFLRYIWVILLSTFLYINYMTDYFVRNSITPTEHKSGCKTTAYHKPLVQTAYFCPLCKYCIRGGNMEIWCWNWSLWRGSSVGGGLISLVLFQQPKYRMWFIYCWIRGLIICQEVVEMV